VVLKLEFDFLTRTQTKTPSSVTIACAFVHCVSWACIFRIRILFCVHLYVNSSLSFRTNISLIGALVKV